MGDSDNNIKPNNTKEQSSATSGEKIVDDRISKYLKIIQSSTTESINLLLSTDDQTNKKARLKKDETLSLLQQANELAKVQNQPWIDFQQIIFRSIPDGTDVVKLLNFFGIEVLKQISEITDKSIIEAAKTILLINNHLYKKGEIETINMLNHSENVLKLAGLERVFKICGGILLQSLKPTHWLNDEDIKKFKIKTFKEIGPKIYTKKIEFEDILSKYKSYLQISDNGSLKFILPTNITDYVINYFTPIVKEEIKQVIKSVS